MSWIRLEVFEANDPTARKERAKYEDVALDMALVPNLNVRLVEMGDKVALEISEEMDACMKGI